MFGNLSSHVFVVLLYFGELMMSLEDGVGLEDVHCPVIRLLQNPSFLLQHVSTFETGQVHQDGTWAGRWPPLTWQRAKECLSRLWFWNLCIGLDPWPSTPCRGYHDLPEKLSSPTHHFCRYYEKKRWAESQLSLKLEHPSACSSDGPKWPLLSRLGTCHFPGDLGKTDPI